MRALRHTDCELPDVIYEAIKILFTTLNCAKLRICEMVSELALPDEKEIIAKRCD